MRLDPDASSSSLIAGAGVSCFGNLEHLPDIVAVAVSGGSDSTALLRLAHRSFGRSGKKIIALTVDHRLRPESADEAKQVAKWCADLGVEHHVLQWQHDGTGNLSAAAREGRYQLMAEFCKSRSITHLYTGHTTDDQAETVLMRFARGSGVDGLAGMVRETPIWGITLVRPFIETQSRESLRAILKEFDQEWIDDPTNDDPSYDRIKARDLMKQLEPLGVTTASLSSLAHRMDLAKRVLQREADVLKQRCLSLSPLGYATLNVDALAAAEVETACRVIGQTVNALSGRVFRAHLMFEEQIVELALRRATEGGRTYGRCVFRPNGDTFNILREPERCAANSPTGELSGIWDTRFAYEIQEKQPNSDLFIGALGEAGLQQISKNYDGFSNAWLSAPREARLTTPGLWHGETLLSAPLAPWSANRDAPILHVNTVWPTSC